MDNFPLRIVKVLMLNPPGVVQAMLGLVRLFVKKKIMDRLEIVQRDDITNFIDEDQLWTEFGGSCEYSIERLIQDIDDYHNDNPGSSTLRIHTISKKGKKKSKNNEVEVVEENGAHEENTNHLSPSRKIPKKKTPKPQPETIPISTSPLPEGINPEDIPEEVLLQLQNAPQDNFVEESDEETNSFIEKIDKSSDSNISNGSNRKVKRSGDS